MPSTLEEFCKSISPYPLEKVPLQVAMPAEKRKCHLNVQAHIEEHGGSIVFGWDFLVTEFYAEAEFHSVWCPPDGSLVDITPRADGSTLQPIPPR